MLIGLLIVMMLCMVVMVTSTIINTEWCSLQPRCGRFFNKSPNYDVRYVLRNIGVQTWAGSHVVSHNYPALRAENITQIITLNSGLPEHTELFNAHTEPFRELRLDLPVRPRVNLIPYFDKACEFISQGTGNTLVCNKASRIFNGMVDITLAAVFCTAYRVWRGRCTGWVLADCIDNLAGDYDLDLYYRIQLKNYKKIMDIRLGIKPVESLQLLRWDPDM